MDQVAFLASQEVQQFLQDHKDHDPDKILLNPPGFLRGYEKLIVQQLEARKKVRTKYPEWNEIMGLVFPPPVSIEQGSSGLAAQYKSKIFSGEHLADLSGGLGVDSCAFSNTFNSVSYVEQDEFIASCFEHNRSKWGLRADVHHASALDYVADCTDKLDFYVDPARRSASKRVFLLEDTQPNVVDLLPQIRKKANRLLIKTSPMLDVHAAVKLLPHVTSIHFVAIKNEMKEVLYLLNFDSATDTPTWHCLDLNPANPINFDFTPDQEVTSPECSPVKEFIYLPNVSLTKAGAFNCVATRYGLCKISRNTHLYTNIEWVSNFPGRSFKTLIPFASKKDIKSLVPEGAHVIRRNHPQSSDHLKKQFGLKEKGEKYVFAYTDMLNKARFTIAERIH